MTSEPKRPDAAAACPCADLTATRVGVRPLPVDRKAAAMPEPSVAAEVHEPLDVELHLAAQITLDFVIRVEDVADELHFAIRKLVYALVLSDLRLLADLLRERGPDTVHVRQCEEDVLTAGQVDTGNTCHRKSSEDAVAAPVEVFLGTTSPSLRVTS